MKFHAWLNVMLLCGVLSAQDHGSVAGNPFTAPQDAEAGGKSFRALCASCHAADATGGAFAPSLVSGTFKNGGTDEALYRVISKGVPGTAMVGFNLSGRDIWRVVTFIRALNNARAAQKATGDATAGAALFASNGCSGCHTVKGSGGYSGPDLTNIGNSRSLEELQSSVTDPDLNVAAEYWRVRASTKAGETVTGTRLNEDMVSFQIRDAGGKLRTLHKSNLARFEILRNSPMPSFKAKLSAKELEDVVAFLAGLRPEEKGGAQ